jgi:Flp pilus assembly protein TadG
MGKELRSHRETRGFVLITTAITIVALIGVLGLCLDLGRMYIAKNELQAFADAAALAAARHLDGTDPGVTVARDTATGYPNHWNFGVAAPDSVVVSFAAASAGPFVVNPQSGDGIQFVRVVASGIVTMYFMPGFSATAPGAAMLLLSLARQQTIVATATSGQFLVNTFKSGLVPYSPDAHDPADPDFGFTPGVQYTLRWPAPGVAKTGTCAGDVGWPSPKQASDRNYIDIGQAGGGDGSTFIRKAIVSNVQSHALSVGDVVVSAPGDLGAESSALQERFSQDTDTTTADYQTYFHNLQIGSANGRRLVTVPVSDANNAVLGFGLFLLQSDVCGGDGASPCCATYVSNNPMLPGGRGGGTPGAHNVRLFQ